MTETTLRAYVRDIDNLIEQEKLDEAIAHCRHVLQQHPKFVECYRLLGKAYLEAKRFGDAADIFQRVLSAVPDDFVSHIGMSLVREDEGNLDSAIWHMERAFETNPANPAIQQELKRLIGQRDGFEPHKVRLTRGALARMYAHGELFPQAIAELRSALQEDGDRPDLQVLLADMFWETDQRTQAAEVSGEILDKLPFCLKATRIMAAVLQERGKQEEAAAYHRRLAQLEPYMAYTEAPMIDTTRIDASSITLARLEWQPGQPLPESEAAPTDWATSLGLDEDEEQGPGTGPLPSWLSDVTPEGPTEAQPSTPAFEGPIEEPEGGPETESGEIPDWMRDAGWQQASGDVEERPVSFSSEELDALERGETLPEGPPAAAPEAESGELEPADIPGWLQGMAPSGEQDLEAEEMGDQELEAILSGGAGDTPADQPEDEPAAEARPAAPSGPADEEEGADVPGWLDEGEPGATSTIMTWLSDRDEDEPEEEPALPAEGEEAPDWLGESADEFEAEGAPEMEGDLPEPEEEQVPGWLAGVAQAAAEPDVGQEEELSRLRQQAEEDDGEEGPAEGGDGVPDWIRDITGEEPAPAAEASPAEIEGEFGWESEMEAAERDTVPQEPEAEASEAAAAPDWIAGLGEETDEDPGEVPADDIATERAGARESEEEWLAGLGEEAATDEDEEVASWLEDLGEPSEEMEMEAEAELPDWMAGMEEESSTQEDEVEELASGWLDDLSDTLAETPAEPAPAAQEEAPDWMRDFRETELPPDAVEQSREAEGPQPEEPEDLSWFERMEGEPDAEPEPAPGGGAEPASEVADLEGLDEEDVFGWLDQMAAEAEEAPPQEFEEAAEVGTPAPAASETPPPESLEEGMEWLEKLAQTRGIDADISREPAPGTPSERRPTDEPIQEDAPEEAAPEEPWAREAPEADITEDAGLESLREQWAAASESQADPEETDPHLPPEEEPGAPSEASAPPEPEPSEGMEAERPSEAEEAPPPTMPPPAEQAPEETWMAEQPEPGEPPPSPEEPVIEREEERGRPVSEAPEEEPLQEPAPAPPTPIAEGPTAEPEVETPPSDEIEAEEDDEVPDWLREHATGVTLDEEADKAAPESPPTPLAEEPEAEEPPVEPAVAETPAAPEEPPGPEAPPPEPTAEQPEAPPVPEPAPATPEPPEPTTPPEEVVEEAPAAGSGPPGEDEEPLPAEAEPEEEIAPALERARRALSAEDVREAARAYGELVKDRADLELVVEDLQEFLADREAPLLWQTLGDAFMRLNRTKDAVRAYDRGMEETEFLDSARQALASGDFKRATAQYSILIKHKTELESVIDDLEQAVEGGDGSPVLWQALGDAYMKAGRVDESIDAYRRGMESV